MEGNDAPPGVTGRRALGLLDPGVPGDLDCAAFPDLDGRTLSAYDGVVPDYSTASDVAITSVIKVSDEIVAPVMLI